MGNPEMQDPTPQYTAGGRVRDPVRCPMCEQTFVVKAELEAHLLDGHRFVHKTKTRKVKTKRAKYMPVEKNSVFGLNFWLMAIGVLAVCVLIGLTAPQLTRFILPAGLLALFLTRAGLFRK